MNAVARAITLGMLLGGMAALADARAEGARPTQAEMDRTRQWDAAKFEGNAGAGGGTDASPFFSFVYDGKPSSEFLGSWNVERTATPGAADRVLHTISYTDPKTGLQARIVGFRHPDFPFVEWTIHFKNTGTTDSPILSDILAIDTTLNGDPGAEFTLHRNKGDNCTADSFEPIHEPLPAKADLTVANTGGRPTQIAFPYFNVQAGDRGFIVAVSWAGQWSARFTRDEGTGLRIRAGQEKTHFLLHPGEEVRGPMMVMQFYEGTRTRAQNVWRQWMIAHNTPRPGGKLPPLPQLNACSSHQFGEMIHADTKSQIFFVDKYLEHGMKLDYWWMDAGWYPCDGEWPKTGTWEVDQTRFPGGFKPISDHAHGKDVKIIVWFEPERVAKDTWLTTEHPDWVLGGKKGGLLNLGNTEAREWLIAHVDKLLTDNGIDLYRQDFNMDPLDAWRKNDAPDRQGITEIRHVEGYFAYWDALRERHPDMLIDSCASGGRRNDLETLRRAVPLLRSDYIMEPVGNQCHTWTLSEWFPFYGTGTSKTDPYLIRSILCPSQTACWDQREDKIDWAGIKGIVDEWKAFAPNYFGDYYPITPYTLDKDKWIGWQFDRPDAGEGLVQVFRREGCPYDSAQLPLKGLDPTARYRVAPASPLNPGEPVEAGGADLMEAGLPVAVPSKPGWAFFTYKRI